MDVGKGRKQERKLQADISNRPQMLETIKLLLPPPRWPEGQPTIIVIEQN